MQRARGPTWPDSASASAARAAHGLAQLGRRSTRVLRRRPHRRTGGGRGKHGGASPARGRRRGRAHGRRWQREGGTVVQRRPTRVSTAGRRGNAAAWCTHRCADGVDGSVGALGHARSGADSGGRRRAWRGGRRGTVGARHVRRRGREAAVGMRVRGSHAVTAR
jgi:hypothetical protein